MVVSPITRLFLFAAVLLVELPAVVVGDEPLSVTDRILTADRVLIVGDSITYGGQYVAYVETSLRLSDRWPNDGGPEIVGVGLPSE